MSPAWRDAELEMLPEDAVVETLREVPLRKSPPNDGLFYSGKGEEIGQALPGEHYRIKASMLVRKPLGNENWLCLEPLVKTSPSLAKEDCAWAYAGMGRAGFTNFNLLVTP